MVATNERCRSFVKTICTRRWSRPGALIASYFRTIPCVVNDGAARYRGPLWNVGSLLVAFELEAPLLEGALVRLEPLAHRHAPDLAAAAEEHRGAYTFTWVPTAGEVAGYIDAQLTRAAAGRLAPYAQVSRSSGRAVGVTAYWDPRLWPDGDRLCAVEVGFTWLAASAQGTGLNTEAKLLLFGHAFEQWCVARVDLKTDARNARSRAAIEAVGRASRGSCAAGRGPGRRVKTASSGIRRSSR
jgi:RimJ/RimL family protein N-acetyltransferase